MIDGRVDEARFKPRADAVAGFTGHRRDGNFLVVEFNLGGVLRKFALPTRQEGYHARERYECDDDDRDALVVAIDELATWSDDRWKLGKARTRRSG